MKTPGQFDGTGIGAGIQALGTDVKAHADPPADRTTFASGLHAGSTVGITAGASTPDDVIEGVVDYLVARGFTVRVYVPYGTQWYPYLMRRLAERPANLWFITGSVLKETLARR